MVSVPSWLRSGFGAAGPGRHRSTAGFGALRSWQFRANLARGEGPASTQTTRAHCRTHPMRSAMYVPGTMTDFPATVTRQVILGAACWALSIAFFADQAIAQAAST